MMFSGCKEHNNEENGFVSDNPSSGDFSVDDDQMKPVIEGRSMMIINDCNHCRTRWLMNQKTLTFCCHYCQTGFHRPINRTKQQPGQPVVNDGNDHSNDNDIQYNCAFACHNCGKTIQSLSFIIKTCYELENALKYFLNRFQEEEEEEENAKTIDNGMDSMKQIKETIAIQLMNSIENVCHTLATIIHEDNIKMINWKIQLANISQKKQLFHKSLTYGQQAIRSLLKYSFNVIDSNEEQELIGNLIEKLLSLQEGFSKCSNLDQTILNEYNEDLKQLQGKLQFWI